MNVRMVISNVLWIVSIILCVFVLMHPLPFTGQVIMATIILIATFIALFIEISVVLGLE